MLAGFAVAILGVILYAYVDEVTGRFMTTIGLLLLGLGIVLNIGFSIGERRK